MIHRHLTTSEWTRAAIDSALEYGDLSDWQGLFAQARTDRALAEAVRAVARAHRVPGSSVMALQLVQSLWPETPDRSR
jgi:hypothetical protein